MVGEIPLKQIRAGFYERLHGDLEPGLQVYALFAPEEAVPPFVVLSMFEAIPSGTKTSGSCMATVTVMVFGEKTQADEIADALNAIKHSLERAEIVFPDDFHEVKGLGAYETADASANWDGDKVVLYGSIKYTCKVQKQP